MLHIINLRSENRIVLYHIVAFSVTSDLMTYSRTRMHRICGYKKFKPPIILACEEDIQMDSESTVRVKIMNTIGLHRSCAF